MQKIKQILNNLLDTGSISPKDYIYLQEHRGEVIKTGNLELMELTSESDIKEPEIKFNKVI